MEPQSGRAENPADSGGMSQIEHVVLLMLENRSLDSLLGWLYERRPRPDVAPVICHGDLHPQNVLVQGRARHRSHRVAAVIELTP